jgi:hypothetical protein
MELSALSRQVGPSILTYTGDWEFEVRRRVDFGKEDTIRSYFQLIPIMKFMIGLGDVRTPSPTRERARPVQGECRAKLGRLHPDRLDVEILLDVLLAGLAAVA